VWSHLTKGQVLSCSVNCRVMGHGSPHRHSQQALDVAEGDELGDGHRSVGES
jgi:hypothetical protein